MPQKTAGSVWRGFLSSQSDDACCWHPEGRSRDVAQHPTCTGQPTSTNKPAPKPTVGNKGSPDSDLSSNVPSSEKLFLTFLTSKSSFYSSPNCSCVTVVAIVIVCEYAISICLPRAVPRGQVLWFSSPLYAVPGPTAQAQYIFAESRN